MKIRIFTTALIGLSIISCKNDKSMNTAEISTDTITATVPKFENKGHELVYNMVQKVGDLSKLYDKKDVVYTYTYQTPDGKTDVTTEKYIFDGELSYGAYKKHERTLPELSGVIEQGYDGKEYWLKNDEKSIGDEKLLKMVAFNRPTNFYWFAMMQKLMDDGVNYEYLNEKNIGDATYNVVKVTFDSLDNSPKDIYQLYINKSTGLVDQFLFTVMDFDKADPLLMQLEYETIDGLILPTKRKYKASNWDAEVTGEPWINVNWTDIKFNNGLKAADFKK